MKTVSTYVFDDSTAFCTLNAIAKAVADQTFTLSTLDYPFLPTVFSFCHFNRMNYETLIDSVDRRTEVVGYNVRVDLEGNVLAKEPIEKRFKVYHLNVDAANRVIAGLNSKNNQKRIQENIQRLNSLLF